MQMRSEQQSALRLWRPLSFGLALAWIGVCIGAVAGPGIWFLNFVHVGSGVLWTGIDLFMGFIIGPVMRQLDPGARREFILRLMPRMLYLMPTLAIVTGTAGWFLAARLGFFQLAYPAYYWLIAALVILALLTVQGLGFLLPTNLRVCRELVRPEPDQQRIGRWMKSYVKVVAIQGLLQIAILVIMAHFATGVL